MGSKEVSSNVKPHVVCIPFPVQSHIKGMLKFAKLLHHKGFHITFVNTDFIHRRFLESLGPNSLDGLPDFRFETIPDGIQSSDDDTTQDLMLLAEAVRKNLLAPFRDLLVKLNDRTAESPPLSHIVSDGWMSFTITAGEEVGIPVALFFTICASSFMGFAQYPTLVEKGLAPLKDEIWFTNGFLDQSIDWIPGMKSLRLRDLPNDFITTDPNDGAWLFCIEAIAKFDQGSAIVLHTFDALEQQVLEALSIMFPRVYAIGPQQLLLNQIPEEHPLKAMGYSLLKEEAECLKWLDAQQPNSVVYVNFGSLAILTTEQLVEFGWGLANSKVPFFWVIRPDLVAGKAIERFPAEFVAETKGRGLISSWCPQEQVLEHESVGGFFTHSGWNSTIESLCAGVPMLSLPIFTDQQTNSHCVCNDWGIGMEACKDMNREQVERLVKELMEGERGKQMKNKVIEWKKLAQEATSPNGSSSANLDNFVNQVLLNKN